MKIKFTFNNRLKKEYEKTKLILKEIKSKKINLIAADYDGTLYDRHDKEFNNLLKIIELAHQVTKKGIDFVFVSGRNATLEVELRELIPDFCEKNKTDLTIWHSGGNGMNLNKISYLVKSKKLKVEKIFSNTISIKKVKESVKIYHNLKIKPDYKSQLFFKKYLKKNIPEDLIPNEYFKLSKKSEGKIFAEAVKVSLVLPTSRKEQVRLIKILRKKLSKFNLNVGWGGIPFADVSKKLRFNNKVIDGKLLMVKNLIKLLNIKNDQVVTFGDTPNDNNQGLLSFPYSFTNDVSLNKSNKYPIPYILDAKDSPVKAVFEAIKYLINY